MNLQLDKSSNLVDSPVDPLAETALHPAADAFKFPDISQEVQFFKRPKKAEEGSTIMERILDQAREAAILKGEPDPEGMREQFELDLMAAVSSMDFNKFSSPVELADDFSDRIDAIIGDAGADSMDYHVRTAAAYASMETAFERFS